MDVKTLTFCELQQKLKYAEDEIGRLRAENAYYKKALSMLAIDPDSEIGALDDVAIGEVLDV